MKLGAHVSTAGGIETAIDRGRDIGCEAIQIFGSSPQSWFFKPIPQGSIDGFKAKRAAVGMGPVFFHCIYLINLGNPDPANVKKGVKSLNDYMNLAHSIDAQGIIFHPGSHKGAGYDGIFRQTVASIIEVLENSPQGPWLTIENTAGMGQHIGARFDEIGRIIKAVGSPRVRVCLDTEHSFAAGYDVSTRDGLEKALDEFDREIGLDRLVAVHANDSKNPLGAGIDRHENIGQGHIGIQGFENIMAHPAFRGLPFFLEVPGMEGGGPDKANMDILKGIREKLGIPNAAS
ncbi:MAG: deoxyribonuclease IV [SAR202 cluster bacterium]|nr:deoxyribonuclease IV [SAR202 cluster bacterium]